MEKSNAQRVLSRTQADAVFTTCGYLKKYLSGFSYEDGYVLADHTGTTLYTDDRYLEEAKKALADRGIRIEKLGADNRPADLFSRYRTVAISFSQTSHAEYMQLAKSGVPLVDADGAFTSCMQIKTAGEIAEIDRACRISEEGFLRLLPQIKEGMTEREVAAVLEYEMRFAGADGTSFDTIVAFGAGASVPHHQTGNAKLAFGDAVLIDFGCKSNGYCSDCTRTFLFGDDGRHGEFKKIYEEVLTAHRIVAEKFRSGMTGKQGDALAREYLAAKGLGKYFTHSLGHGIGLNIHEEPRLSPRSEQVFADGMVFSDEPGVYIEGELGIRIEDSVRLENGRVRSFFQKTEKKLVII